MLDERQRRRFTIEEYLWLEERSETKNEYVDGEIFAMTGGSLKDLASLEEYVLVAQDQIRVERNQRKKRAQWVWTELVSLQDQLELRSVSLRIPLQAVYRAVQLPESRRRKPPAT